MEAVRLVEAGRIVAKTHVEGELGTVEALREEFAGRREQLRRMAAGMGLAAADVEDVLQDVYVAVLGHAERCWEPVEARRWLMRVVINRCVLEYRRRRRFGRAAEEILRRREERATTVNDPAEKVIRREELEAVRLGLGELEAELLGPMVLQYWLDMNSKEIGEVLELNDSTVRSRLRKGRIKIAMLLKNDK